MNSLPSTEVEDFLRRFRRGLATLPADIREDLVQELRSHLEERFEQGKLNLSGEFGPPEEYATRFLVEQALSTAVARGTSLQLIAALVGKVRGTALVIFVVLPLTVLEIAALMLVAVGVLKPFSSGHVGLFLMADGSFGGFGWVNDVSTMHEVLGYTVLPLFIFCGLLLFWIGNRLLLRVAHHELAQLRRQ